MDFGKVNFERRKVFWELEKGAKCSKEKQEKKQKRKGERRAVFSFPKKKVPFKKQRFSLFFGKEFYFDFFSLFDFIFLLFFVDVLFFFFDQE